MNNENSLVKKPFIHISRRSDVSKKTTIIVRVVTILSALLMCGLVSTIVAPGSFLDFYIYIYEGTLFSFNTLLATVWNAGLLLLIAAAITPAFKMKFWNIGAEGQVLMGALGAVIIMKFVAPSIPNALALLLMLVFSIVFSSIWAFIPSLFKALFNTNETLFTLMMNYIAIGIVASFSLRYKAPTSTALGIINQDTHQGWLPEIGGYKYIINIIVIIVLVVLVWGYLKFSKHGYEIAVLNGSERTAEYVGINVKTVTMRTMILCGVLCGIAGFLIVAGASHTVSDTVVGGRGFTAVMISWLGHFNPLEMALYALLNEFISTGGRNAAGNLGYSVEVARVLSGLFFLAILTSEFFTNFRIKLDFSFLRKNKNTPTQNLEGGK
ncbi:MAG TPA: ABC transporter permease [Erysipelotrichaceae bacterium]|nr:ABC transporter permease [Erysipelotrichaceae bacterium]